VAKRYICGMGNFAESLLFIITTPLFIFFILLEIIVSNLNKNERYSLKGFWENMYLMILNSGLDLVMRILALFVLSNVYTYRLFDIDAAWVYWTLLLLVEDLTFYVIHYVDHYVRLFWAVHVTHHNSQEYNLTVGLRSSLFEPIYRFIYFIPAAFIGFKAEDIFFIYSLTQLYGVFLHTQYVKNFGFLDYFMISPSQHRVHHGSNVRYLDKNMGMFLNVWDKLFGTYERETEPVVYGLTTNIESHDPREVIFHEFKAIWRDVKNAPNWYSRWMYVFGPPGWSHDGSRKTSKQLRANLAVAEQNKPMD
jgi:sterol desaturase/sphingolipid hydroxylase (fatty acid hydroxylase superfamily)